LASAGNSAEAIGLDEGDKRLDAVWILISSILALKQCMVVQF